MSARTAIQPPPESLRERCAAISREENKLREGGGKAGQDRQHKMGRLLARERINQLLDKDSPFFEVGLWAAYKMYQQWGNIPAAGAVAGIGNVCGVPCLVIANDGRRFLSRHRQEAHPRPADRLRMRFADYLSRRFRGGFSPHAGRNFSRRRRFWPDLSK
jgi:acetyl-CoA carboxylase carboxyltransferase component